MTLPSRRKLPITRPNTRTSASCPQKSGICWRHRKALAALPMLAIFAAQTAWAEPSRGGHAPWSGYSDAYAQSDAETPTSENAPAAKPKAPTPKVARPATGKVAETAARQRVPNKARPAIRPAAFDVSPGGATPSQDSN